MAGFDQELTRKELNIPEGYALHAAVAVGKLGDKATLAQYLQAREEPSPRRPLSELAAEGDFTLSTTSPPPVGASLLAMVCQSTST